MQRLKISDISKLFNIPPSALRYYEKENLCHFSRDDSNYRWADMRTLRNLCDISFYKKLSCSIEQLRHLPEMTRPDISLLLTESRIKAQQQINELNDMIKNIDDKLERIAKVDELLNQPGEIITTQLPFIREFSLFRTEDISNLINYEKNLFVIIESDDVFRYYYGIASDEDDNSKRILKRYDDKQKKYYKTLLITDYEKIEDNNLLNIYREIQQLGYHPGKTYGKVLVSSNEDALLKNYYEAWIELKD